MRIVFCKNKMKMLTDGGSNQESQGPPQLSEEEIAILDQKASFDELNHLSDIGASSGYPHSGGEEMILDTRQEKKLFLILG